MKRIKEELYEIIFEADTWKGKLFDIVLLAVILLSIALVMLESVQSVRENYRELLKISEWVITIVFTLEYFLRIAIINKPLRYI